jgi:hypothetical protein
MFFLDDILLLPVTGVVWVAERIRESAEAEMADDSKLKGALLDLQTRLEMAGITEEEYRKEEERLLERLEEMRIYKKGKGAP